MSQAAAKRSGARPPPPSRNQTSQRPSAASPGSGRPRAARTGTRARRRSPARSAGRRARSRRGARATAKRSSATSASTQNVDRPDAASGGASSRSFVRAAAPPPSQTPRTIRARDGEEDEALHVVPEVAPRGLQELAERERAAAEDRDDPAGEERLQEDAEPAPARRIASCTPSMDGDLLPEEVEGSRSGASVGALRAKWSPASVSTMVARSVGRSGSMAADAEHGRRQARSRISLPFESAVEAGREGAPRARSCERPEDLGPERRRGRRPRPSTSRRRGAPNVSAAPLPVARTFESLRWFQSQTLRRSGSTTA